MRRSRRLAVFLMLSSLIMRKSRRIAAFFDVVNFENEEISQNSSVFKVADRQVDRLTDRQTDRERER